jgi:hypothetical protein
MMNIRVWIKSFDAEVEPKTEKIVVSWWGGQHFTKVMAFLISR